MIGQIDGSVQGWKPIQLQRRIRGIVFLQSVCDRAGALQVAGSRHGESGLHLNISSRSQRQRSGGFTQRLRGVVELSLPQRTTCLPQAGGFFGVRFPRMR